jgi:hypothetical protein
MDDFRIGFGETFSTGPLVGFSSYPEDEQNEFNELNIYLLFVFIHIKWR